jgi:hypothetical protein
MTNTAVPQGPVPQEMQPAQVPAEPQEQLSQSGLYDNLITSEPGFEPVTSNEEPSPEEQANYDEMYAAFVDELYGPQRGNAEKMLESGPQLYESVSTVAFNILSAVHQRQEQKDGPVPGASLFGAGGMISTAVDEVFAMAKSMGIPDAQTQDQYTAAQMHIMKLVGEHLEKSQDDDVVGEAQETLLDIETADGTADPTAPLDAEENASLRAVAETGSAPQGQQLNTDTQRARQFAKDGAQEGLQPENVPPQQGLV